MAKQLTLLISSAGRRVELIECFRGDARRLGIELRVIAADATPERSAACQVADLAVTLPRCTDATFAEKLLELCQRERVTLVVPTIDTELPVLAANRAAFAQYGIRIIVSDECVVDIARDKWKTAHTLEDAGVLVPRTAPLAEILVDTSNYSWPLVLKPRGGSSSIGLHIADSIEQVRGLGLRPDDYVAQERWSGREFTVNFFVDSAGTLKAAIPHWRIETRGGEVSKGRTTRLPDLAATAQKVAAALPGAYGPLCFQAILAEDGRAAVFEINARFGGGFPLAHRAGAQFSQWLLEEAVGLPSSANDQWEDGLTMLRYDAAVFRHD